ncbi:myo-inositol transport ITR1 [Fusarium albosuccineum]|uniref:Myo-inositol transport ITR1 n=1 Tax=Fusarium albosuccineum TaxID=1237068 RepID=A0A8H4PHH5_9HYPO|nr:myo-inositol transport ITR1 [Fusarium albosuccineum]
MAERQDRHSQPDQVRNASLGQRFKAWIEKQIHARDEFGNSLVGVSDLLLRAGIDSLCRELPTLPRIEVERAAEVARNGRYYYLLSKGHVHNASPVVILDKAEKNALVAEREQLFSQRGMLVVISTVSLAAFLQGHVQSSFNAGSLFVETVGIYIKEHRTYADWQLGGMNAIPFLTAAFPGAPLSLPANYCLGRRGALGLSAILIIASSLGSAFAKTWVQVLGARIVGGIAMGIKAVSAPILASETAVGYWRGSTVLAWQLWVACGIMVGFVVNFAISGATDTLSSAPSGKLHQHDSRYRAFQWILGAPAVPALFLLIAVCFCYESPRFYMRPNTPNYNLGRAFEILRKVRQTDLQATRDLFLIWWSTQDEDALLQNSLQNGNHYSSQANGNPLNGDVYNGGTHNEHHPTNGNPNHRAPDSGLSYASRILVVLRLSAEQFKPLFTKRSLRNALWSSCTVALAQQLCGINVFAFYSNAMFSGYGVKTGMAYSLGFGAVNFVFALPAMRSIDIIGRRRWLLSTLPIMSCFLMAATIAYAVAPSDKSTTDTSDEENKPQAGTSQAIAGIIFIYLFAAAYSPGLGPIPFTLASESFPLQNREAGASVAIAINLCFAGLLTILIPRINAVFKMAGTLGFFAGLNVVAFVLIYLFVEETKQLTLEELEQIFNNPKRRFASYQLNTRLPFFLKKYLFFQWHIERPSNYDEYVLRDRQENEPEDWQFPN